MKSITLYYPDDMKESDAVEYLPGVFNEKKHDYRAKEQGTKRDATAIRFMDERVGLFWVTKKGYNLKLEETEREW